MEESTDRGPSTTDGPDPATLRPNRPEGRSNSPEGLKRSVRGAHSSRVKVQVLIQLLPGAEPWVRVITHKADFRIPAHASALELYLMAVGVRPANKDQESEAHVSVPLSKWQEAADALGLVQRARRGIDTPD